MKVHECESWWWSNMAADTAIRIAGLSKDYGRTQALRSLTLEVAVGEVLGYLGPNGAGKTTTIRLLLGLIQPTAGRAEIFGLDCHERPGRSPQTVGLCAGRGEPVAAVDRRRDLAPARVHPRPGGCGVPRHAGPAI